jgi:OOP family OmpA-OmpF porin
MLAPAPPPVAVAAPTLKPKPTVTLGAAELFAFNQATLTPAGRAKLDKEVVERAKNQYAEIRSISIGGHTDRLGTSQYNQKLSERRAEAVRTYLVSRGMDGSKIQSHGYGKTNPVKACPAQTDRKALIACLGPNRRVEIEISGTRS